MTAYSINIAKDYGTDLSSRFRAGNLREQILQRTENLETDVEIDFSGVRIVSESFADELFAILVLEKGEAWFRQRIHVVNLPPHIRQTILATVANRLAVRS